MERRVGVRAIGDNMRVEDSSWKILKCMFTLVCHQHKDRLYSKFRFPLTTISVLFWIRKDGQRGVASLYHRYTPSNHHYIVHSCWPGMKGEVGGRRLKDGGENVLIKMKGSKTDRLRNDKYGVPNWVYSRGTSDRTEEDNPVIMGHVGGPKVEGSVSLPLQEGLRQERGWGGTVNWVTSHPSDRIRITSRVTNRHHLWVLIKNLTCLSLPTVIFSFFFSVLLSGFTRPLNPEVFEFQSAVLTDDWRLVSEGPFSSVHRITSSSMNLFRLSTIVVLVDKHHSTTDCTVTRSGTHTRFTTSLLSSSRHTYRV